MKSVLRHVFGWGFLLLGIAGLVLPILQGWLFIAIAAFLLAPDVPLFGRLLCWIQDRSPRLRRVITRLRARTGGRPDVPPCADDDGA